MSTPAAQDVKGCCSWQHQLNDLMRCVFMRKRERERKKEKERETETDRETDRERERERASERE